MLTVFVNYMVLKLFPRPHQDKGDLQSTLMTQCFLNLLDQESIYHLVKNTREQFFPVLDAFLAELNRRFNENNVDIMRAIQACNPCTDL